ncbi:hypothetical protein [Sciscionella sediminilitoris]|uniref:aa3-type cytochrome oxidase subunit CtaJ n=1 Tax=Sciscionella sediminilitoris TaxID=1445613 RepID=UPI0004DF4923|nr:hypothetical protein [Sciscionella sp. SE31]
MTVWQTILVYVVIPAALYGLIALLSTAGRRNKAAAYRPGKEWNFAPVWWGPNPVGAGLDAHGAHGSAQHAEIGAGAQTTVGGASGNW